MKSENGLELKSINSESLILNEIKSLTNTVKEYFKESGLVVAYQSNKILIGKYDGNNFHFFHEEQIDERKLLKIRIFNNQKELFLWKSNGNIKGRLRIDTEGEEVFVVDAYQQLWGTDFQKINNSWTKIFEERGTELILPFSNIKVDNKQNKVFIKTRNYIEYHSKSLLATYGDCRFVGFYDKDKKQII